MAQPDHSFTPCRQKRLESIVRGQSVKFTSPNTLSDRRWLHTPLLRISIYDSPSARPSDKSPVIAAMIVPKDRETDWIFCTGSGQFQLLLKTYNVSRLILIGNLQPEIRRTEYKPSPVDPLEKERLENELIPLLMPWHPKVSQKKRSPKTLFLTEEDDVAFRANVDRLEGPIVDQIQVEDVEVVCDRNKQLRRRMRFKRMPKVVQSEALLLPIIPDDEGTTETDLESLRRIEDAQFVADTRVLVQEYLIHMVAGLFLISSHLSERPLLGLPPTALCLGVGGGVLLSFLNSQLGFLVVGVEADEAVLGAARQYFGFNESGSLQIIVGDAIEVIQNLRAIKFKFDVVFVDLDSSDAKKEFCAPPPEFVNNTVFECLRSLLDDHGVLIMNVNVVPLNAVNERFCITLVRQLWETFGKVYRINVGTQDKFVAMATVSPTSSINDDNAFSRKLGFVTPGAYRNSIEEL